MSYVKTLHVGLPNRYPYGKGEVNTAIVKKSVPGPLFFTKDGPEGNKPANHTNAVYAFCAEDYQYWNEHLKLEDPWPEGFLGENLTVVGIDEDKLKIGDLLHIGSTILQISGVRIPCSTLMWRIEQPNSFSPDFQRSGRSGFYMEVLQEGEISPGDEIRHEPTRQESITIPDFARFFMQAKQSVEDLERLMNTDGMGSQMLDALTAALNSQIDRNMSRSHRWQSWRPFVIEKVVQESEQVKSFYLAPEDGLPVAGYRAGQFLNVRLTVPVDNSTTEIVRSWSISSYDEACQQYRISIKREPGGLGSGYMHDQIREGDVIEILAPAGRFVLERGEIDKPAVLISAGIGITPMLSMLNSHAARRDKILPTLYFIHSTQNRETEAFREEIENVVAEHDEIQNHFIHTKPSENSQQGVDYDSSGRLNIEQLKSVLADMQSWFSGAYVPVPPMYCRFYICGPDAFQKSVVLMLEELGVPEEQVHQETFRPTEEDLSTQLAEAKVTFSKSGSESLWQPDENFSLLELAENAGLEPTFGCRSGTCGLCSTPLTKGEVSYSRKPSIEVSEGNVLLCCSRPVGDLEVDL